MSKYSNNFKLEVIQYYLKNYGGHGTTAMHFNIPSSTTVKKWVKQYEQHSFNGLIKNEIAVYCYKELIKSSIIWIQGYLNSNKEIVIIDINEF